MNCTCQVIPCDFEASIYSVIALRNNQTFFIKGEQQEAFQGLVVNHFDIFFKINADEESEVKADAKRMSLLDKINLKKSRIALFFEKVRKPISPLTPLTTVRLLYSMVLDQSH